MPRHESVSEQIERLGLQGELPQMETFESAWADIIGAVLKYQQEHERRSPSNPMICHVTGLSPGQLEYHLAQMQKCGLIDDKEGWPRRLIVTATALQAARQEQQAQPAAPAEPQPEEKPMQMTSSEASGGRHNGGPRVNAAKLRIPPIKKTKNGRKKREPFIVNAKRFAQVVFSFEDEHGYAPLIKDMAEQLGYNVEKPVGVSRTIKEMVKRGWLFHERGHHGDFAVTEEGIRVLFGGQKPEPKREQTPPDIVSEPQPEPPPAQHKHRDMTYPEPPPRPEPRFEVRRAPEQREPERRYEEAVQSWRDIPRPVVQVYRTPEAEEKRWPEQEPGPEPEWPRTTDKVSLAGIDTLDLVLELTARGFRVTR
jgi:hypothetical protein